MDSSITLVVARYMEPMFWIPEVNKKIRTVVFNKGNWVVIHGIDIINDVPNEGREGGTYLTYICDNYDRLSDITIFTQADPFQHNVHFLTRLDEVADRGFEGPILPLTYQWTHGLPPFSMIKNHLNNYFIETISRCTLQPMRFHDDGIASYVNSYMSMHPFLHPGCDLVRHFCDLIGLNDPKPEGSLTHTFFYSGCFAVKREAIHRHPLEFYQRCRHVLHEHEPYGYMFERMWLLMFEGATGVL